VPTSETNLLKDVVEVGGTLVLAVIGWAVIARIRRRLKEEPEPSGGDLLSEFQKAYDAGEIDEDEFRRVRESLNRRSEVPSAARTEVKPCSPSPSPPAQPLGEVPQAAATEETSEGR
jgi:hypothetical protein